MQPLQFLVPLDWLHQYETVLAYVILAVALANVATRMLAYRKHREQAEAGEKDAELSRYGAHTATTVALVLLSFLYMIVEPHGGMVLSALVLGLFFADFFEYEARRVEARNKMPIERPKAGITASVFVVLYAGFQSVFALVAPYWNAVI